MFMRLNSTCGQSFANMVGKRLDAQRRGLERAEKGNRIAWQASGNTTSLLTY